MIELGAVVISLVAVTCLILIAAAFAWLWERLELSGGWEMACGRSACYPCWRDWRRVLEMAWGHLEYQEVVCWWY